MHPIVASAAWVFAAGAPSKVPFYVAGAVLACWAFGVALTGISRPGFARSMRTARAAMATSAVLVAATITTAITTAGEQTEEQPTQAAQAPAPAPSNTLQLAADPAGALAFDRTSATVRAGALTIRFANDSPLPHNVTIARGAKVVAATRTITGGRATATAKLAAGDYVFYCSVDAHRSAGMQGTLTVR